MSESEKPNLKLLIHGPIDGDDLMRMVQENIEEGKRNAPDILKAVAFNLSLNKRD